MPTKRNIADLKNKADAPYLNRSLKNIKGEKWKEIPGTDDNYLISNFGRVKALSRYIERGYPASEQLSPEKILKPAINKSKNNYKNDYTFGLMARVYYNKKMIAFMIGRLVYQTFVQPLTGERMKGKYVYPIDGNPFNMHASNLALATKSEMRKADFKRGRFSPQEQIDPETKLHRLKNIVKFNKTKRTKVKQYKLDGTYVKTFPSITAASKKTGISIACISACAYKKLRFTRGIVWRFENDSYDGKIPSIKRIRQLP